MSVSEIALTAAGLSKAYRIGLRDEAVDTLLKTALSWLRAPARNWRRLRSLTSFRDADDASDVLWALRDASFEVKRGEVLGIIGRNGAGKTTLLKILSRVTEPTCGRAVLHGRVSSLLEVGTGFHPELTGRENVYMNGTILGMTRREIRRKYDRIVEFAEVERFIDTPVKRYSSGMRVRLAFAVAAHLEPEILVIDEVLAVGDASFQQRCIGKMSEVARGGRTVLFVSHNMASISSLCTSAMLIADGTIVTRGEVRDVISDYLGALDSVDGDVDLSTHEGRRQGCRPVLRRWHLTDVSGRAIRNVCVGDDVVIRVGVASEERLAGIHLGIRFHGPQGERLMTPHTRYQLGDPSSVEGNMEFACTLRNVRLLPGRYRIDLDLTSEGQPVDYIQSGLAIDVIAADVHGTGKLPPSRTGIVVPEAEWTLRQL